MFFVQNYSLYHRIYLPTGIVYQVQYMMVSWQPTFKIWKERTEVFIWFPFRFILENLINYGWDQDPKPNG